MRHYCHYCFALRRSLERGGDLPPISLPVRLRCLSQNAVRQYASELQGQGRGSGRCRRRRHRRAYRSDETTP